MKISFYNTDSVIYFACSKNLDFCVNVSEILHGCLETRNKFHISAQPCNILYLLHFAIFYNYLQYFIGMGSRNN